jgi:geranylgeranyl diphosphate synthase type I
MSAPLRSMPAPASLTMVAERVERRIDEVLSAEISRWADVDADLADPLRTLATMVLEGGKRLRPTFCYWGFVGAGGRPEDPVIVEAGAAFELLQAFALIHDDIMDGSALRRGERTAHLTFADHHGMQQWRGEARRFGEGVAILIGDLAHAYADRFMVGVPPAAGQLWSELRLELNAGQYLDMVATARRDTDLDRARRIALYKSGKYTIERPLHVGAALAGGSGRLLSSLSAYGRPLGEAFQLRDDLLGAFGDQALTGKPVGDDFREGKSTPLLALATANADPAQHAVLATVGRSDLDQDDIAAIQAVLVDAGAVREVEAMIDSLVTEATAALDTTPLTDEATDALRELAAFVGWRER